MTLRNHLLSGEPILYAPDRAGRPNAFAAGASEAECPFCPGEEAQTPPTIEAAVGDDGAWLARAFANKYPAIDGHEVIVESPRHRDTFDTLVNGAAAVRLMLARYAAHPAAAHVALFKNQGRTAGASLPHTHSQLVPLPFVPPRIAREATAFSAARCVLCEVTNAGDMIVATDAFVWLAPHGSTMAHQTWIVPRAHENEPGAGADVHQLATLLQHASRAMLAIADAYNWSFTTFRCEPRGHWYVDLFPRPTTVAGFELGTGSFITTVDPADTARRFRESAR